MPTVLTHALVSAVGGSLLRRFSGEPLPFRFWPLAILCAVIPDFDAIGALFGLTCESMWGHRGVTHSLLFAALFSLAVAGVGFGLRRSTRRLWPMLWGFFFIMTMSHILLDMLVNGHYGVALLAPFEGARYHFAWKPMGSVTKGFLGTEGIQTMLSEFLVVWAPSMVSLALAWRRMPKAEETMPAETEREAA